MAIAARHWGGKGEWVRDAGDYTLADVDVREMFIFPDRRFSIGIRSHNTIITIGIIVTIG